MPVEGGGEQLHPVVVAPGRDEALPDEQELLLFHGERRSTAAIERAVGVDRVVDSVAVDDRDQERGEALHLGRSHRRAAEED